MLLRIAEVFLEFLVKITERLRPTFLTFFDFVELFFQPRRVLDIEDVAKIFNQQIGHDQTNLGWEELPSRFLQILPFLNCAEDGRIG